MSSTAKSSGPVAECTPTGACCSLAPTPTLPSERASRTSCMDMTSPGIDVRPIRNAVGDSHFCEVFLDDVVIPAENLLGAENAGWQVAQADPGRRARHDDAGAGRTPRQRRASAGSSRNARGQAPTARGPSTTWWRDRLAGSRSRSPGSAGCAARWSRGTTPELVGPADASIVKLYYSELLQRLTDFGSGDQPDSPHTPC